MITKSKEVTKRMKIMDRERLIDVGDFSSTDTWKRIESDVINAIATIEWPPNSGSFDG
jgi:hypothetical protein